MTITVSPKNTFLAGDKYWVIGKITFVAADTYAAGGITVDLAAPLVKASRVPDFMELNSASNYIYSYFPGADIHTGKVRIYSGALAEITAGAMPAGVQSDSITFLAIFQGML